MRALFAAALLLGACKKRAPDEPIVDFTDYTPVEDGSLSDPGSTPVGPGRWVGGGLSLFVPPGWSGLQGPPPRLLRIEHEVTGVGLELLVFPEPLDAPRPVEGEECGFVDTQRFRAVPVLGTSHTATCTGDDRTRQVWWGPWEGRELHVEAQYPPGRMIQGRQTLAPMLESIRSATAAESGQQ
ncbi:MAG: hypothetical protein H6737_25030 [Alphaproteobacteria bacterium]|nr:hypothetical protein [Alphaproteobacteria bacterium]